MKTASASARLCVLVFAAQSFFQSACGGADDRYAQYRYQRRNYTRPPQTTNPTNTARPTEPVDKPQKFRELAIGTEYYFLADKDRKLFPWRKVSPTQAQSLPTPGRTNSTLAAVPGELFVIVKKESRNENLDKNKEEDKKQKPPTKQNEVKK